jgi:5-formyltetrahydrofolate cyclo-ligase
VIGQNPNADELVAVFENIDHTLVSIARDALESVEIESFIFDENSSRIGYGGGHYTPMRLMVYADRADEARECLRELGIEK